MTPPRGVGDTGLRQPGWRHARERWSGALHSRGLPGDAARRKSRTEGEGLDRGIQKTAKRHGLSVARALHSLPFLLAPPVGMNDGWAGKDRGICAKRSSPA